MFTKSASPISELTSEAVQTTTGALELKTLNTTGINCDYNNGACYYFSDSAFIHFHRKRDKSKIKYSPLKLHLNLKDKFREAFDEIFPTLDRTFFSFKVTNPNIEQYHRYVGSAQFTIYLRIDEDNQPAVVPAASEKEAKMSPIERIKKAMNDIATILKANKIEPGKTPDSDIAIDEFFSWRDEENFDGKYIGSEFVGSCTNTSNRDLGGYAELLPQTEFCPVKHFEALLDSEQDSAMYFIIYFRMTLEACISEYFVYGVPIGTIMEDISHGGSVDAEEVKPKYRNDLKKVNLRLLQLNFLMEFISQFHKENFMGFFQYQLTFFPFYIDPALQRLFNFASKTERWKEYATTPTRSIDDAVFKQLRELLLAIIVTQDPGYDLNTKIDRLFYFIEGLNSFSYPQVISSLMPHIRNILIANINKIEDHVIRDYLLAKITKKLGKLTLGSNPDSTKKIEEFKLECKF